jgi:DNA-binding SARP family transcriptional activator
MRRAADVALGSIAAVTAFGAVPVVLVLLVGDPVPHPLERSTILTARGTFDALAIVAWVAWALCCWHLLRSVASRVRARDLAPRQGSGLGDRLAARIAAAVLVLTPFGLAVGSGAAGAAGGPPQPGPPVSVSLPTAALMPSALGAAAPQDPPADALGGSSAPGSSVPASYTVEEGDSLWSIAQALYGDGGQWQAIAALNLGRLMNDGQRFVDPSLIQPGWVLDLADATARSSPADGSGAAPSASPASSAPGEAASPAVTNREPATAPRRAHDASRPARPGSGSVLPGLAMIGIGAFVAALLARRVLRRRRLPAEAKSGTCPVGSVHSEEATDLAIVLAPLSDVPAVDWLDMASRHLGATLAAEGRSDAAPAARLVRVGTDGVEVWLADATTWAPEGWELAPNGQRWRLSCALDPETLHKAAATAQPWLPVALPVGDSEEGTWLVPVAPGSAVSVLGPEAKRMVSTMRRCAEGRSSLRASVVTHEPRRVREAMAAGTAQEGGVLFVGDPEDLTLDARHACGILTTRATRQSSVTVVVDERVATIHPLGVSTRPHLLTPEAGRAYDELLDRQSFGRDRATEAHEDAPEPPERTPDPLEEVRETSSSDPTDAPDAARPPTALAAGIAEVRMLTSVPRIEGLVAPLPPKRARRAVELVAYLALHHPDPVTSDRLRTRVLGSPDADAAAKTLFNTAGAARRSLGSDDSDRPLLPPASRAGQYRISSQVTIDVVRVETLTARAREEGDPETALALLRAALELVEGEPLAATLSGYAWWQAEGHEARFQRLVVGAACDAARLAIERGHVALALAMLERGRRVDPYSERLTRWAMRAAGAGGDRDQLRREWEQCRRRSEELEPGSEPTERTGRLYRDLSRQVLGPATPEPGPAGQASLAAIDDAPRSTVPSAPAAL